MFGLRTKKTYNEDRQTDRQTACDNLKPSLKNGTFELCFWVVNFSSNLSYLPLLFFPLFSLPLLLSPSLFLFPSLPHILPLSLASLYCTSMYLNSVFFPFICLTLTFCVFLCILLSVFSWSIFWFVCVSVCLSVCLCLLVCPLCPSLCPSFCLSFCFSNGVYVYICQMVFLYVCLPVFAIVSVTLCQLV